MPVYPHEESWVWKKNYHRKVHSLSYHHPTSLDATHRSGESGNHKSFSPLFILIKPNNELAPFDFLRQQNKTNLQNAFQCLRVYIVEKFCFISIPNLSHWHLIPFSLVSCGEKEQLVSIHSKLNSFDSLKTLTFQNSLPWNT